MGAPVNHKRINPKASAPPTAAERRHMDRVAGMPCLVSGKSPVTLHHPTGSIYGGRITRSHKCVVPLVPEYHLIQQGPKTSVEALGHAGFYKTYGIDLEREGNFLWLESVSLGIA